VTIASDLQVQNYVDLRVRPRCEQLRTLLLNIADDKATLDDIYNNLTLASVKASGVLTHNGTALTNLDTVTIGTRVYTFKTVIVVANDVLIGAATASLTNLTAAINGSAGSGTTYGTGTVAHADVDAVMTGNIILTASAKVVGVGGNAIAKAEASTNLAWDAGAFLNGGVTNPTWKDARVDGPPHLALPSDVLDWNAFITALDAVRTTSNAAQYLSVLKLCVRGPQFGS